MGSFVFNLDPRVTVLPPDFRCPCAGRAEKVTNPPGACRETTAFDPSKTSRVLLLSDLNSNVPATIAPQNIQAIISGAGDNQGQIKYIKDGLSDKFTEESIVYTSGTGAIFKSGVPIGKIKKL